MAPKPMPSWVLKAPRVVLVIAFPLISLILYLILSLGCINDSVSGISPIVARSNGPVTIGGETLQIDIRIGFWGLCIGPPPLTCTPNLSTPPSTTRPSQLAALIPPTNQGAGNFALAALALALQSSFLLLSGLPLLLLLLAALAANLAQLYFNARARAAAATTAATTTTIATGIGIEVGAGERRRHHHAIQAAQQAAQQAALWARSLDWAAAAGAATGFAAYQAMGAAASRLVGAVGVVAAGGVPLDVRVGGTASGLFAGVVVVAVGGAVVNTVLAGMDVRGDVYVMGRGFDDGGSDGTGSEMEGRGVMGRFQKRAAYERFP